MAGTETPTSVPAKFSDGERSGPDQPHTAARFGPATRPGTTLGRYAPTTPAARILVFVVVAMALAAACGGAGGTAVDQDPIPRVTGGAAPLVTLVRYGGIAGASDRVSVDALGVATVTSDRSPAPSTRTLSGADLASIRRALERSEIATLQRNYLDHQVADAYQFDITYQGATVTADEGVLPATLRPVVDLLVKLIA